MHPQSPLEEPSHIHVERPSRAQLTAAPSLAEPRLGGAEVRLPDVADEQAVRPS
jgi:hypothetical protein